mmetsp:Transcript_16684/g.40225  ORF Transcript_16684/g.40225 Transcript_16684/m.40225 type:complete len:289 (+) Transcript_16684:247-1113(+)
MASNVDSSSATSPALAWRSEHSGATAFTSPTRDTDETAFTPAARCAHVTPPWDFMNEASCAPTLGCSSMRALPTIIPYDCGSSVESVWRPAGESENFWIACCELNDRESSSARRAIDPSAPPGATKAIGKSSSSSPSALAGTPPITTESIGMSIAFGMATAVGINSSSPVRFAMMKTLIPTSGSVIQHAVLLRTVTVCCTWIMLPAYDSTTWPCTISLLVLLRAESLRFSKISFDAPCVVSAMSREECCFISLSSGFPMNLFVAMVLAACAAWFPAVHEITSSMATSV